MEVKKMLNYKEVPNKDGRLNNQNLTKTTVERFKKKGEERKKKEKKTNPQGQREWEKRQQQQNLGTRRADG